MSSYNEKVQEYYDMENLNKKQSDLETEEEKKKKEYLDDLRKTQSEIDEIKNKYVVKFETKPIVQLTENELLKNAEEQVGNVYAKKLEDLTNSSSEKIGKLNAESQTAVTQAEMQKKELENAYKVLDKKAENDAMKKGVQRSSIIAEKIKSLSKSKIQEMLGVDEKVADTLYKNNAQIQKLEDEYKKSVNNLETAKAVEIKQKLQSLINEQDKQIVDTIKYNEAIKKEEARQNEALQNLYSIEGKDRVDQLEIVKITNALNYFMALPKEEALKQIEEDEIKNLLGNAYTIVHKYLNNK